MPRYQFKNNKMIVIIVCIFVSSQPATVVSLKYDVTDPAQSLHSPCLVMEPCTIFLTYTQRLRENTGVGAARYGVLVIHLMLYSGPPIPRLFVAKSSYGRSEPLCLTKEPRFEKGIGYLHVFVLALVAAP